MSSSYLISPASRRARRVKSFGTIGPSGRDADQVERGVWAAQVLHGESRGTGGHGHDSAGRQIDRSKGRPRNSPGSGGIFWTEIATSLREKPGLLLQDYLVGLGGGDVTPAILDEILDDLNARTVASEPVWKEVLS